MAAYLTVAAFKDLSVMPGEFVDELQTRYAGFLDAQLAYWSSWIDSKLRKRYAVPFASPYPTAVTGWLARIVTQRAWLRRGVGAQDEQWRTIEQEATDARAEVNEAADSEKGLFDLPLRADTSESGISKSGPLAYSEQSPYVWTDQQVDVGRQEDQSRRGSGG